MQPKTYSSCQILFHPTTIDSGLHDCVPIHVVQGGLVLEGDGGEGAEVERSDERREGEWNPSVVTAVECGEDHPLKHQVVVCQLERLLLEVPEVFSPFLFGFPPPWNPTRCLSSSKARH
ncbi:UNVERIFIED_CONTAM: hypothetical protein Sindi_1340500 [Sesamum indicum]